MDSRVTLVHVLEENKFTVLFWAQFKQGRLRQNNQKVWTFLYFLGYNRRKDISAAFYH